MKRFNVILILDIPDLGKCNVYLQISESCLKMLCEALTFAFLCLIAFLGRYSNSKFLIGSNDWRGKFS